VWSPNHDGRTRLGALAGWWSLAVGIGPVFEEELKSLPAWLSTNAQRSGCDPPSRSVDVTTSATQSLHFRNVVGLIASQTFDHGRRN